MKWLWLIILLIPALVWGGDMSRGMWPYGLRLGSPGASGDKANIEYTGKLSPVPADATSSYARLLDKGKKPKNDAVVYSGQMLDFDGEDDYVATTCELTDGDDYTICVTAEYYTAAKAYLVNTFYGGNGVNNYTSGYLYFNARIDNNSVSRYPDGNTEVGKIYRCVFSVKNNNNGTLTISGYKNGLLLFSDEVNGDSTTQLSEKPFVIGKAAKTTVSHQNGLIGNVQIWDKAFTPEEVAADYANPENVDTSDPHLKGWWPLIEGSGDTAYDWSGNGNPGTLTNFDTAICWEAGKALSNPRVLQTAYMPFNLDAGVLRPIGTSGGVDFTREHNELNWNGKTKTSATITIAKTVTLEAVVNISDVTALQYIMDGRYNSGSGYVNQTGGTIAASSGTVYVNGSASTTITSGMCHVVVSGLALDLTRLDLMADNTGANLLTGQMPLFRLWYDVTWDAATVAKYYSKAQTKYGVQ